MVGDPSSSRTLMSAVACTYRVGKATADAAYLLAQRVSAVSRWPQGAAKSVGAEVARSARCHPACRRSGACAGHHGTPGVDLAADLQWQWPAPARRPGRLATGTTS